MFQDMTGVKNFLVDIKPHTASYVTFGIGAKGEIKGVGITLLRSSLFSYMLYVGRGYIE